MSVHTPAPWHHDQRGNFGNCVVGPSGKKMYEGDDGFRPIALVQNCIASNLHADEAANQAANIALIVAAPEMLALLQELIDIEGPQPGTSAWATKVRAVIAKASGEQPTQVKP